MAESGHPVNLENFGTLIKNIESFGGRYKPSNTALAINNLKALEATAKADIKTLSDAKTAQSAAENDRSALFAPLDTLTRRIISSARSAGAAKAQLDDMEETARKIKGERAGAKKPDPVNPGDPKSISVSQQSYTNLAAHLDSLIGTLSAISAYAPNEDELKIASLQTLQQNMTAANSAVSNADIDYEAAKTARNNSMYGEGSGLVDMAALVKDYIFSSSKDGAKNPDYKAVKSIPFTRLKK